MKAGGPLQATNRGVDKQARAGEARRRVRIFNADGALLSVCDEVLALRYSQASNAEVIRAHNGRVVAVRLLSVGGDTPDMGHDRCERHGDASITVYLETISAADRISKIFQHKNARF